MEIEEVSKSSSAFIFEHEISKIKILVPLTELMKNRLYIEPTLKVLNSQSTLVSSDVVNLQDEHPTIIFGLKSLDKYDDKSYFLPPFYITFIVHDRMLQNFLLDFGASHNLMPKAIMEALGLSITKPYHELYHFDSRELKCLLVIKDLIVRLT